MDDHIQISKLNDFIFCPFSLYFHSVYEGFSQSVCHSTSQTRGKIVHRCFDRGGYSTEKKYLQGLEIYSENYGLAGKLDLFDSENGVLIERKNKIKRIYDGYVFQVYAQCFCLQEMGYKVKKIFLHSLEDNKRYSIPLPKQQDKQRFKELVFQIRHFNLNNFKKPSASAKCAHCIYRPLCFS